MENLYEYEEFNKSKKSIKESVRRGMFPYFAIDKKDHKIRYGTLDNDLSVDAMQSGNSRNEFQFAAEGWTEYECKEASKIALEMLKKNKSENEIRKLFFEKYVN